MSFDLEIHPSTQRSGATVDLTALALRLPERVGSATPAVAHGTRIAFPGSVGFSIEQTPRGLVLSAGADRTERDEHAMAFAAVDLAGPTGEVFDRHTARTWAAELLLRWLVVAPPLSGRALALNEERIRRVRTPTALADLAASVKRLAAHVVTLPERDALRTRVVEELNVIASRPACVWTVAPALAALGDFERLESMLYTVPPEGTPHALEIVADVGAPALPLLARALDDPDPNHRRIAAATLHRVRDAEVLPLVVRALDDKRATVREAVLVSVFEAVLALPEASRMLAPTLERLTHDPHAGVRRRARELAAANEPRSRPQTERDKS